MTNHKLNTGRRRFLKTGAATAMALSAPAILRAEGTGAIRVGMPTILSGVVSILGESSVAGAKLVFDEFNASGGLDGRKIELITRDSRAKPEEAAKAVRDLVNGDGCNIILDAEASSGSFAVQEVIKSIGALCLHTVSEATPLSADPALHAPTAFRSARQGIHDAIGGGAYAAAVAKEKGLKRWATCSPDYAYGRTTTAEFMEYAKYFNSDIEVIGQAWPKLFQPDYTEVITRILQWRPDALYSALWGGDLVSFIDQANLYALFDQTETFSVNLGDYPVLTAVEQLPNGMRSGSRYNKVVPNTPENNAFYDAYVAKFGTLPTNWSWENATAATFVIEALKDVGTDDPVKLAEAIRGRTIASPFGVDGTLTMRAEDHTLTGYAVGYGVTTAEEPFMKDFHTSSWEQILELEADWKKRQGFA
ncbi:ABC transporter substrate-binding protein [Actibacterium mucosum]|uniref:ABC transporter substrate-binding protein n=1 Tax=Actibacterium mucosum TaxID=1087332 RepID=UPI00054DF159|nr:ABC transporter substrate-binding protein [Actibacterium mucosum]